MDSDNFFPLFALAISILTLIFVVSRSSNRLNNEPMVEPPASSASSYCCCCGCELSQQPKLAG